MNSAERLHLPRIGIAQDVIDAMHEALVAYDADGRLVVCNSAFRAMYGYTASEARPGVHFRELGELDMQRGTVAVEDEHGADYLERKARYRRELQGSFTVKLRDGRWIKTTDRPMRGGGFVSVQVDVTELREARLRLEAAQREARASRDALVEANRELERKVADRTRELDTARLDAEARARTDSLTGLLNRDAFLQRAREVHATAGRYGRGYALMMLDVDHFKQVNDVHGHLAGDRVLEHLGATLRSSVRESDVAGRLGGEEFASIAPESNARGLQLLAERLRNVIADTPVCHGGEQVRLTVSIGIAELTDTDATVEDVMSRADVALYSAKSAGRNRTVRG